MKIDKLLMSSILLKQEGFTELSVKTLLDEYPNELDDRLKDTYLKYMQDLTIEDVTFDGVSLVEIMKLRREHYFRALRDLNRLMSTQEGTEDRATWKRILTSPVYFA